MKKRWTSLYELIILSILMGWSFHGYVIAKIINDIIGPFAKASTGRIYPLLNQMERDGLVVSVEVQEGRSQRVYSITDHGRKRFHQLMMDTSSNPKGYQELFWYKVTALQYLEPAERLHLIDHYITYCQAHILHLNSQVREFHEEQQEFWGETQGEAFLSLMGQRVRSWELEVAWARDLRAKAEKA